jgi:AcrR family transcriptional regulator
VPKIAASERDAFYESRRAELADVALRLWAERGFDQTSVEAIAREAGLSKGAFYLYFDSKDSLLEDVLRRNTLVPNIQELADDLQHLSLEEAVHGFVAGAWRHLCDNRDLVLVALRELPTHIDQAQQLVERVMVPANQLLAGYLESRIDPERAEQLSLIISGRGLLGMLIFVFLTQDVLGAERHLPVPEPQITRTIADLFLHGVMAAPSTDGPPGPAEGEAAEC